MHVFYTYTSTVFSVSFLPLIPHDRYQMLDAKDQKERDFRKAFDFCQEIVREPMPDYVDDGADDDHRTARAKLAATIKQKLQVV